MRALLLHSDTEALLQHFVARPAHAVLLLAPSGAGKRSLARDLAARLLQTSDTKLDSSPYFKSIEPVSGKSISIESVRDITHFLMLRTPRHEQVSRVVIIENAGRLTPQAQNALLKTIEEPPVGTVLILTAPSELDILPTICSRVQTVTLRLPDGAMLREYFAAAGYDKVAIDRALMMSDGLPGLTQALLAADKDHIMVTAAARARDILQKSPFERLIMIDELTKEKDEWLATLTMLRRMAQISLGNQQITSANAQKWHKILSAAYEAHGQTAASAQVKLVALHFMLSM